MRIINQILFLKVNKIEKSKDIKKNFSLLYFSLTTRIKASNIAKKNSIVKISLHMYNEYEERRNSKIQWINIKVERFYISTQTCFSQENCKNKFSIIPLSREKKGERKKNVEIMNSRTKASVLSLQRAWPNIDSHHLLGTSTFWDAASLEPIRLTITISDSSCSFVVNSILLSNTFAVHQAQKILPLLSKNHIIEKLALSHHPLYDPALTNQTSFFTNFNWDTELASSFWS